jgi:hypothetical protein
VDVANISQQEVPLIQTLTSLHDDLTARRSQFKQQSITTRSCFSIVVKKEIEGDANVFLPQEEESFLLDSMLFSFPSLHPP